MKNVLLLVHDDPGQEARLQVALDLTRALSGHLHCLDVTPPPVMADPAWGSAGTILYDETEREQQNLERLNARLANEDVAWTSETLRGDFAGCLASTALTADLTVLNRGIGRFPSPDMRMIIGEMVGKTQTLVMAVPEDCRALILNGTVIVAWDGSETAMRTVQRAAPLLMLARSVTVFQAGALPENTISARDAATYLARHGIDVLVEMSDDSKGPAAQISDAARRYEASYCVMGAYGHSRLKETIFGGVTHEILRTSGLPLLLGH